MKNNKKNKTGGRKKPKKALTGMEIMAAKQLLASSGQGGSGGQGGQGDQGGQGGGSGVPDLSGLLDGPKKINQQVGDFIRNEPGINIGGQLTDQVGNVAAMEGDVKGAAINKGIGSFMKSGKLSHGIFGGLAGAFNAANQRTAIEERDRRISERRLSESRYDPFQYAKRGGKFPIKRIKKSNYRVAKFQDGGDPRRSEITTYFETVVIPHYVNLGLTPEQAVEFGLKFMQDSFPKEAEFLVKSNEEPVSKPKNKKDDDVKGPITLDPVTITDKKPTPKDDNTDLLYSFFESIKTDDDNVSSLEKKIDSIYDNDDFAKNLSDKVVKKLKKEGKGKVKKLAKSIYMPGEKADIKVSEDGLYDFPGEEVRVPFSQSGGTITMKNIPHSVLGVPNVGKPKLMKPDNVYSFPRADYVDEIPMKQEGGMGSDEETLDESEGIQTEKGERVLLPNLDIAEVNASKRHKDMDDFTITDVLPDPSYVFSANEDQFIDLKALHENEDENVLGFSDGYYDENKNVKGEDILITDILGKKGKLNYAQAAEKIKKHYQTRMSKDNKEPTDVFTKRTNRENKEARIQFLKWLIQKQESERPDDVAEDSKEFPNGAPKRYRRGGIVKKYQTGEPEPFPWWTSPLNPDYDPNNVPGPVGPGGNVSVVGPSTSANNRGADNDGQGQDDFSQLTIADLYRRLDENERANREHMARSLEEYEGLGRRDNIRNASNSLTRGFALGMQDPVVDAPILRANNIHDMFRGSTPSSIDQQIGAIQSPLSNTQRSLLRNGVDPRNVVRMTSPLYNQTLKETNNLGSRLAAKNRELDRRKYSLSTDINNKNEKAFTKARNETRGNRNAMWAGFGDIGSDYINTRGRIDSRGVAAKNKIRGDYLNNDNTNFQNRVNVSGVESKNDALQKQIDLLRGKGNSTNSNNQPNTNNQANSSIPTNPNNPKPDPNNPKPDPNNPSGPIQAPGVDNIEMDPNQPPLPGDNTPLVPNRKPIGPQGPGGRKNGVPGLMLPREGNMQGIVPSGPGLGFDTRVTDSGLSENPGVGLGLHNPIFALPALDLPNIGGRGYPTIPNPEGDSADGSQGGNASPTVESRSAYTESGEIDYSVLPTPPPPPSGGNEGGDLTAPIPLGPNRLIPTNLPTINEQPNRGIDNPGGRPSTEPKPSRGNSASTEGGLPQEIDTILQEEISVNRQARVNSLESIDQEIKDGNITNKDEMLDYIERLGTSFPDSALERIGDYYFPDSTGDGGSSSQGGTKGKEKVEINKKPDPQPAGEGSREVKLNALDLAPRDVENSYAENLAKVRKEIERSGCRPGSECTPDEGGSFGILDENCNCVAENTQGGEATPYGDVWMGSENLMGSFNPSKEKFIKAVNANPAFAVDMMLGVDEDKYKGTELYEEYNKSLDKGVKEFKKFFGFKPNEKEKETFREALKIKSFLDYMKNPRSEYTWDGKTRSNKYYGEGSHYLYGIDPNDPKKKIPKAVVHVGKYNKKKRLSGYVNITKLDDNGEIILTNTYMVSGGYPLSMVRGIGQGAYRTGKK